MSQSIEQLMERVGCTQWPVRWNDIYEKAMAAYEKDGCPYTSPSYYDMLANRYRILKEELETFKEAAEEIGKREDLSRFLMLLCTALEEEAYIKADLEDFKEPHSPEDSPCLGLDMLTGLALYSCMPRCYQKLKSRNLPDEIIEKTMDIPEATVKLYRQKHGGAPGFDLLWWHQRVILGKMLRIARFEAQIPATYQGFACAFTNEKGEYVLLAQECPVHRDGFLLGARGYQDQEGSWVANITETADAWQGYPYDCHGFVEKCEVTLRKSQWKKVFEKGAPVIALHIPAEGRLSPDVVDQSIAAICDLIERHYPEYQYRAITCNSWLINPVLLDLLGENSNISQFCKRFFPAPMKTDGYDVFRFVFGKKDNAVNLTDLPEDTHLQKTLKQYYLNGGIVHEMAGFLCDKRGVI